MATTLLLVYDSLEAIQYTWAILDFTILAQYLLYNKETLRYIEYIFYRLENTKIGFKH